MKKTLTLLTILAVSQCSTPTFADTCEERYILDVKIADYQNDKKTDRTTLALSKDMRTIQKYTVCNLKEGVTCIITFQDGAAACFPTNQKGGK